MSGKPDGFKPPYKVPSMGEVIAGAGDSGLTAVSTFSGCGGSSLGLKMAGIKVLWASEFIPAAADTYRANHPDTVLDTRDIRKVKGRDILEAIGLEEGGLDILDGSPPCSAFSVAGKKNEKWGKVVKYSDTKQRVDDLFYEYIRLVKEIKPRVFIAENVPALSQGVSKGMCRDIMRELAKAGYVVKAGVLDSQWLGVPQARRRLFFQGVRKDLNQIPAFPKPLRYRYNLLDALPWLLDPSHPDRPTRTEAAPADFTKYALFQEWRKLSLGGQSEKYFQLIRANPSRPVNTVTATHSNVGAASITHPYEPRKFTIRELKRLCGFPDDFILTGTYQQQGERLGRAVPPPVMAALGLAIRRRVLHEG